ncbi:MAG: TetR/AcrR family transcriptional regulator [Chloroflexi bacterium]|nr:MAG: TetR/AcrR family transcriptional regulator [Chloroflexota bacterium]
MMRATVSWSSRGAPDRAGAGSNDASVSIKCLIDIMSAAAVRPAKSHREDRREALVRAAFNQIAERGFEGLRTREVAAEVGLNIATLHYYFPTKEALIRGVIAHAMQRFRTTLAPHGASADPLRRHLRAVRTLLRDEPQVGAVHRTLRGLLKRAARDELLAPELNSDDVAALIMATLTSMTLPTVGSSQRVDQAFRQLERVLRPPLPASA